MADFRKWLFAFALVALLLGGSMANAQIQGGMICQANAGAPVIVRSEGITELVGDLLLVCTGGTPTASGQQVAVTNVTLTLNTNITSRLLGSGFIDALLLIDEPFPAAPHIATPPGTEGTPVNSPAQKICYSNGTPTVGQCNYLLGTGGGGYGVATDPYIDNSTVYVAQQAAANQVTWLGVPIDPPGSSGAERIIRLTNVRGNACQLGLSSTLIPTQIIGFVSVNPSQNILINNPQQTLAYIQQGLFVTSTAGGEAQCNNTNLGFTSSSSGGNAEASITVKEGFAASFKRAVWTGPAAVGPLTGASIAGAVAQNVPGASYFTESGLMPDTTGQVGAPSGAPALGLASAGTRILVSFNNVGSGINVYLPVFVPLIGGTGTPYPPSTGLGGWTGGFLQLIGSSDANGDASSIAGASASTTFTGSSLNNSPFASPPNVSGVPTAPFNEAAAVSITGNTGSAVYEVVNADPSAIETATIAVGVSYTSNTGTNTPPPGVFTGTASFAPLSTVGTADSSAPIPRFCNQSTAANLFTVSICQCQLLFPFVTQAPGFDTGIAIANTSLDTYNGVTPQTGTITLYFYGQEAGGAAVPTSLASMTTSAAVPAGQVATYTLFSGAGNFGAGWTANPGFTGYIIAVSNFQWCHGFAFISDLGAQKLAEGYLAIQLDLGGLNRTGNLSEQKAH